MLLARRCAACGTADPTLGPACPACVRDLVAAPLDSCPQGLDGCDSLVRYEGAGRGLIVALKYHNRRNVVGLLAAGMAALVDAAVVEVVTWAPTSTARRRRRGYDQSRLLAAAVARELDLPMRRLLRRLPGPAQTGRSLSERHLGPVFLARGPARDKVLVVDDVVTTGATLSAAADALRRAGASGVRGLTAARTPLKLDA